MHVRAYTEADAAQWDRLCAEAHGSTFLHTRRFLSYHVNRFTDLSLIVEEGGRWLGVLPAAQVPQDEKLVASHPGITYGGLLHEGGLRGQRMIEALEEILRHYASSGYRRLLYKSVPHIYHRAPAQDDLYALFRLGAVRSRCDLSCAIDLDHRLPSSDRRNRSRKKAEKAGVRVAQGAHYVQPLWEILKDNLARKHGVAPVHSLDEITMLIERFPSDIRVVVAELGDRVEGGVVLFLTPTAHHAQYIASSEAGYQASVLDAVFEHCIRAAQTDGVRWFDFGTSNEEGGRVLNEGLYRFKAEFGGGGVAYEQFELEIS